MLNSISKFISSIFLFHLINSHAMNHQREKASKNYSLFMYNLFSFSTKMKEKIVEIPSYVILKNMYLYFVSIFRDFTCFCFKRIFVSFNYFVFVIPQFERFFSIYLTHNMVLYFI